MTDEKKAQENIREIDLSYSQNQIYKKLKTALTLAFYYYENKK
jgi:hypothetical protein